MVDTQTKYGPTDNVDFRGNIAPNFLDEYWVGLKPLQLGDPILWAYLGDGITGVTPKYTDKKKTAAYQDGGGNEQTTVTGVTESYDITGDRSIGGMAQDLIAALKSKVGSQREMWFRKNHYIQNNDNSLTLATTESGLSTMSDIDDGGGTADDNGSFKATATYLQAQDSKTDLGTLNDVLTQTPCQNSGILGVPLRQPQEDGTITTYEPVAAASASMDGDVTNSRPATLEELQGRLGMAAVAAMQSVGSSTPGSNIQQNNDGSNPPAGNTDTTGDTETGPKQ